jgi:hypothetical protein
MKRFVGILLLLVAATPLCSAKEITVRELKEALLSLHQAYKTDEEVATRLKELNLSEELTRPARSSLAQYLPGPLSEKQLDILQGRSSGLAPPPSDLPDTPAPDDATQKAILAKAQGYLARNMMRILALQRSNLSPSSRTMRPTPVALPASPSVLPTRLRGW